MTRLRKIGRNNKTIMPPANNNNILFHEDLRDEKYVYAKTSTMR